MKPVLRSLADATASLLPLKQLRARLLLSRAKHPSLRGHAKMALRVSKLVPFYEYDESTFFRTDGAPPAIADARRRAFERLASSFRERAPETLRASEQLEDGLSDVAFVNAYRVPFQFRNYVRAHLKVGCVAAETDGPRIRDLDGNWAYDLGGAYGVNLFGSDFYKACIDRGVERARPLGMVLGAYHPVIADNVERLKEVSGLDEVSFHMSGTEAVMQAVRLARYHTRRTHIVRFCGAYHGWWDGVQAGPGNPLPARDVYTLKEMDADTLRVLATRRDVACVLVNPIQAMHPNASPPGDSTLVAADRAARYDRAAYTRWLQDLRRVCDERGIVLVFDEVMLGFRLARGGVQEYFGVRADMVTYGKSLGGGLPIGVVCGRRDLMRRYRDDRPADMCFARGTFNSHPYVMTAMNEFLRHLDRPEVRESYETLDELWDTRIAHLNDRLGCLDVPVRLANMTSVATTLYSAPSRYNWMLQYYLRSEGLALGWIGTGRFIFSHDIDDGAWTEIEDRFVRAGEAMKADGWFWCNGAHSNGSIKRRVLGELIRAELRAQDRKPGRAKLSTN